jgi:CHAT domain-containing protein
MKTIIIAGLLLFFQLTMLAQTPLAEKLYFQADSMMSSGDLNRAATAWSAYLKVAEAKRKGIAYSKLGACYFNLYENDSAIKYMNLSIAEKSKDSAPTDTTFLKDHAILGFIYRYELRELRKALRHYEAERRIIETNPELVTQGQRYQNFYNLATTNRLLEDFNRALNYAYSALDASRNDPDAKPYHQANCYAVIANALNNIGRFEEAVRYYDLKINSNIEQNGPKSATLALDYYNQGVNLNDLNKPGEAITVFNKALRLIRSGDEDLESSIYIGIATAFRLKSDANKTITFLEKAIAISPELSEDRALAYRQYALLHENNGQFDEALEKYQQAFKALIPGYNRTELKDSPEIFNLTSDPLAFELLSYQARCWLMKYRATQLLTALQNAHTSYEKLDKLTDSFRKNYVLESSRLHFQKKNHSNYEKTIEVVYELYHATEDPSYLAEAWLLIEQNKSLLLLENVLIAEKFNDLGIPDSIQDNMAGYSKALLSAQKSLNSCEVDQSCSQDSIIAIRQKITTHEELLRASRRLIETNFPEYHSFASSDELKTLADLKAELGEQQLLLNYFAGEDYYYFIATSKEFTRIGRVQRSKTFDQNLYSFLDEISGRTLQDISLKQAYQNYVTSAYALYSKLLKDLLESSHFNELIIIPDGSLAGVPFEALISQMPDSENTAFNSLNYLIKSQKVNYGFSATLWARNMQLHQRPLKLDVTAFGTSLSSNKAGLARLDAVKEEFTAIAKIKGSKLFSDEQATVSNFRSTVGEAPMIHLALHNLNDYENPLNSQLIFNRDESSGNGSLFLYDIFNMKMKPSLVVLSGCETGVGKWQKGEGTYHMGRAFLFHGNPALVMSLWKVSDGATAKIMSTFYQKLSKESTTSQAIHDAKLAYLQTADGITAHPRNWAAFISMGQISAEHKKIDVRLLAITSILLLAVLVFALRKKRAAKLAKL